MSSDATLVDKLPSPHLVVKVGGRIIQQVTLQAELSIGRAEDSDLRLTDPRASRHHARVVREGATFILTDLGSANGTLVDGVRLTAPHSLRDGEQITIGDTELTYQEPGASPDDTLTGPLVVPAPPPSPAPTQEAGRKRGVIIGAIVAAAAVLLIMGVVVVFLLMRGPSEQSEPTSPITAGPGGEVVTHATATGPATSVGTLPNTATPTPPDVAGTPSDIPVEDLLLQAKTLTRQGKFREAINIYQDLVDHVPEDARPEAGWAWALIQDDEADLALEHAQRAVDLDPTSADASSVLARVYIETGDLDSALAAAQNAVELNASSAKAHAVLAEAYLYNDQLQEAVEEADLALVQDSNSADAHRIRGWLYHLVDNDMGRAAGELQIAAGLEPDLWLRRHELGELLLKAENYTTAILAFQDALGLRPKAVTYTAIGEAYYRLGQYDQARASLMQALSAGAEDVATYALLGATYAYLERCDDARANYEQALDMEPADPLALEAKNICEEEGPPPSPSSTAAASALPTPKSTPESTPAATKPPAPPATLSGRFAFPVWNAQVGQYDTYVAKVDGSGRQLVVDGMHQPAFSPNGEWLAVKGEKADYKNLFIVHPDGSELKKITDFLEDKLPSWSPNSGGIVLSTTRDLPGRPKRLYVVDDVISRGRPQKGRLLASGSNPVQGEYATWMPDWRIVYQGCDYTIEPQECGLYTISAGGGDWTKLTDNGEDTAPAAYGGRIAFMSNRDGNWELYIINDDGTGLKRLTNNAAHDGLPAWSPKGGTIAFASNQGGAWAIWAMSPNGTNRRKLFEIGGNGLAWEWETERISWGP